MEFKHQKQNPPNLPQKDSPIPCMPCEKTPWQPTPGLSGTLWLEYLFQRKQTPFPFVIFTFTSSQLRLPHLVEPSKHNEPPIPCPSQASDSQLP
ncbi:hypothetical protein O181_037545 [Austropuccinia psidii MF-1]|uniref:Uncharacterized protein n=1 Tax=Austropuccinia psidii MF-1 TaxID=1389203 RepID=A0A9Q3HD85_9BASI|nr:hypothetical protein [Austropuccinia psidii MF-1]